MIAPAPVSPLAVPLPVLPAIAGVKLAVAAAGIRYRDRPDMLLVELPAGTSVAGVFTRNRCPGEPVDWCRAALKHGKARGLVVNAGNANVFTGDAGRDTVKQTAHLAADLLGCKPRDIFIASTGVIGEKPPTEKLLDALPGLHAGLRADAWPKAVRSIMTTDTFPKAATRTCEIGGVTVTINGIAKGSGMVAPDLATMLCFVFTDAKIPTPLLQQMLRKKTANSFNCITVDSDTSTSDTVLCFATGQAKHPKLVDDDRKSLRDFRAALQAVLLDLALQVVRDGEGARKLIKVEVTGAVSNKSAHRVAMAIANSPLVKTAVAGEDANWGRVVMAVGKSGEPADRDRLSVSIAGTPIAQNGAAVVGYDESPVVAHMRGQEIRILVDLGRGRGCGTVWGCDLTHGYIDINGSYRS